MYYPVRNPHGERRSAGPSACCCLLAFVAVTVLFACGTTLLFVHKDSLRYILQPDVNDDEVSSAFEEFVQTYRRDYASAEETDKRRAIFESNYRKIVVHNRDPSQTCQLGVNQFADLSDEEFERMYLSKPISVQQPADFGAEAAAPNQDIDVNWVTKGKVTDVKDQGLCGSCWTFSAISITETLVAIKNNTTPERYSEQQLVDCCKTSMSNGCHGGEDTDAFKYLMSQGIAYENVYPYHAMDETCKQSSVPMQVKIDNYFNVTVGNNTDMERVVQTRTMSVGVCAGAFVFRFYKGGVVTAGCPDDPLSHAVTVVGAGTQDGTPYWLVRNSWGPNWGDKGYLKIARTPDGNTGVCGIAASAQYISYGGL